MPQIPTSAVSSVHDHRLWIERVTLTDFRSYAALTVEAGPQPVVLVGPNGAGKTNLLEAISLLAPGQGLRRAPFAELARAGGNGGWVVSARTHTLNGAADIGTGIIAGQAGASRQVRIDGVSQSSSGILADYVEMVWVTPAMDGLFTGPAAERRRFLDRLILCFDAGYRTIAGRFERAMTARNRLLSDGVRDNAQLEGFELQMAETGIAIAAARAEAVAALTVIIETRRAREPDSAFPWSTIAIDGAIERDLATHPAVDVEDAYVRTLRTMRERDRAAGRTLDGPHRSDLIVGHGPKAVPARLASTGEQKALLLGLVLAHAELVAERQEGAAPILLLDEVTAHLDVHRRAALFGEIRRLGAQAWMTGNDRAAFEALAEHALFLAVDHGLATAVA
ncbi:MAG: DNA replication/repair protein RecF [Hyphomicrobium sp.]